MAHDSHGETSAADAAPDDRLQSSGRGDPGDSDAYSDRFAARWREATAAAASRGTEVIRATVEDYFAGTEFSVPTFYLAIRFKARDPTGADGQGEPGG